MVKLTKRFRAAQEAADLSKEYTVEEAVETLAKFPKAKFDETVELSMKLLVDPRKGEEMVRGTVMLPHGSGKTVRVLAFTSDVEAAKAAGATEAGLEDMIEKVQGGWVDFDVAVATPDAMKEVRKIARVLGPKGLMPNPKAGTVSPDIDKAIKEVMAGRVEFKLDKSATLGVGVGKRSFSKEQIAENVNAILDAIGKARPAGFKGRYIRSASISGTMTPGLKIAGSEYSKY
ncbi:50S ribosomal protein L1 [Candidatus Pelagisphaera phototrophica]|uniref:50S ribosomal protein L1 n=1 Tax=Candidatus Pelagisphaera phototrophica TaxID=2684113 RepID=UPI001A0577D9|nr:50S ribosomal protein L1 [Candidatus Pelagisphaera phototrophica]QXD31939.1 50S ribosomal protein L1 [Candidatus Pelagisphaera phototrophica]